LVSQLFFEGLVPGRAFSFGSFGQPVGALGDEGFEFTEWRGERWIGVGRGWANESGDQWL
jgi:hypothetical protein